MRKIGCIIILILFLGTGIYVFTLINKYNSAITRKDESQQEKVSITIEKSEQLTSIRQKLVDNGVIQDEEVAFGYTAFKLYTYFNKNKFDKTIQAGSYQLKKGSSIEEIADVLQKAENEDLKITIREDFRIEEIAEEINRVLNNSNNKKSKFNKNEFVNLAKAFESDKEYLKSRPKGNSSLEGYLFPDTYFVAADATAKDIISLMLENFDKKVYTPNAGLIKNNKYTLHQLLTIASIVQKEVIKKEDMAMVADIFFRRFEAKDKLGSDVTVIYALGYSQTEGRWWRKDLTYQELELNSPYNTRKFPGLPPGPIVSPGLQAITGTLQPVKNEYYFFISDKDGITRWAKTLSEHESNVRKYLQ